MIHKYEFHRLLLFTVSDFKRFLKVSISFNSLCIAKHCKSQSHNRLPENHFVRNPKKKHNPVNY